MTYTTGGKVQSTDYNNFIINGSPNVNSIWSTGQNDQGYGQTALSAVNIGTKVLGNPWTGLTSAISRMASHQGSSISPMSATNIGDKISFIATIANNINVVNSNRLNAVATGTDITNSATRTTSWGTAVGIPTITSNIQISFVNGDAIRYFFNAGGTIRVSCSATGGSGSPQDLAWQQLCSDIGTLAIPAVNSAQSIAGTTFQGLTKLGGGGAAPDIYVRNGYYQLAGSPLTLFRQYVSSGVYTNDYLYLNYSRSGSVLNISVTFVDSASGIGADLVDSDITVTAVARPPSTNNISNSWGTPTVSVSVPA